MNAVRLSGESTTKVNCIHADIVLLSACVASKAVVHETPR